MNQTHTLPHIVIIGAGFGGLRAARALAGAAVRVTLLDRHNYHLFQPLLYQVATASVSPDEIAHPVRAILRRQVNLEFRMAEVNAIDPTNRRLFTGTGEIHYDALILAAGGQTHYFGLESIERNGFGLKDLADATAIRNHLLRQFEQAAQEPDEARRQALLTFVIVGGGPTGVELAGALSELVKMVLRKDYPQLDLSAVRILLLEAFDRLLPAFPERLQAATLAALQKKGVEVRLQARVAGYDGERVALAEGETIPARTLIWAAGVQATPLAGQAGAGLDKLGRVRVLPTLQVPGRPEILVIGDAAYLEDEQGHSLPMVAPVAIQQAEVAARNALAHLRGSLLENFIYRDPGALATIGRNQAVARLGRFQFTGFLAWVLWLGVHIIQLIGFRNRLLVLLDWARDYFFYDRAVRLILPEESRLLVPYDQNRKMETAEPAHQR